MCGRSGEGTWIVVHGGRASVRETVGRVAAGAVAKKLLAGDGVPAGFGEAAEIRVMGRHDPAIPPRIVPVAGAMVALVLADHLLRQRAARM